MTKLYETYKALRSKYPDAAARMVAHWARNTPNAYLNCLPDPDKPTQVDVPGVGHLTFELVPDMDHNPWEDEKTEWRRYGYGYGSESDGWLKNFGASRGGWYSLNHSDRGSYLVIKIDDLEDRAAYHSKCGASKQVAREAALASIRKQLHYWYNVATGEVGFYGYVVRLFDQGGNEVGEDSCWGFDVDWTGNSDYLVETMDEAAQHMVEKQRQANRFADAMANAL